MPSVKKHSGKQIESEKMKSIIKEVLKHEVFPALGCTEPIAVAYAASLAARELRSDFEEIHIAVDPGVFKNGIAITVPMTNGEKGNLIAGVLGALIKKPELKMEILSGAAPGMIKRAKGYINSGKATIEYLRDKKDLYIEVVLKKGENSAKAVLENSHTNLARLEKNGNILKSERGRSGKPRLKYKVILKKMSVAEMIDEIKKLDAEDYRYLKSGIELNMRASEEGKRIRHIGFFLSDLVKSGYLYDDIFSTSKILAASASDARMSGLTVPVMTSGCSGNQGILAILVPYHVGKRLWISEKKILQSIALSHLINSYIKCFTGDLSPLCGCAIAAGIGATVAIVYQQKGKDIKKINLAVNNLVGDLGGMLCDGAKGSCALKVASAAESAIRSAYMAIHNYGITDQEGFVGATAEETIKHLAAICDIGMSKVNDTMLEIMMGKRNLNRTRARSLPSKPMMN